jgi:hypothetical protein
MVVTLVFAATPADCTRAYEGLRYEEGIGLCQAALSSAAKDQLPDLYRHLGLSFAALGQPDRAEAAFVSLLTLEPGTSLDASLSPKLRAPFEAARRHGTRQPISLRLLMPEAAYGGEAVRVSVQVDDGLGHPIVAFTATLSGGTRTQPRVGGAALFEIPVPLGTGDHPLTVRAVDRFGGTLAIASGVVRIVSRRGWPLSWQLWTGVAAGVLAGATVAGAASQNIGNAANERDYADEAHAGRLQSERLATGANIGFVAGAALLGWAGWLWATEPKTAQ